MNLREVGPEDLPAVQLILSRALARSGDRYVIHPGDVAWWVYHSDPRRPLPSFWLSDDELVILGAHENEIIAFATGSVPVTSLIEWAQGRLGGRGVVGWVAGNDRDLVEYLERSRYVVDETSICFRWDLEQQAIPGSPLPTGWQLRPIRDEDEADARRAASHAAFASTMDRELHLQRYLTFMRSPVYDRDRDLVAVAPGGRVAAFMVWWPDASRIAQIEPFGTHPDFQRRGVGTSLMHHGLRRMRQAGMQIARVMTDDWRPATSFYASSGFATVGSLHWWRPAARGDA